MVVGVEVHVSVAEQRVVAAALRRVFGGLLVTALPPGATPQSLERKIVLKGRTLPATTPPDADEDEVSEDDDAYYYEEQRRRKNMNRQQREKEEKSGVVPPKKRMALCRELASCFALSSATHPRAGDLATLEPAAPGHAVASLDEEKVRPVSQQHTGLARYARDHLVRVFPPGAWLHVVCGGSFSVVLFCCFKC